MSPGQPAAGRSRLLILSAAALGIAYAALVIALHQLRPDGGIIRLSEAAFTPLLDAEGQPAEGGPRRTTLPDDWRNLQHPPSRGRYQLDLHLNVASDRLWAVYVPALEMTPAIYVNDVLVTSEVFSQPLDRYWNRPVMATMPNGLLKPGTNRIAVELAANGPWGRLTELYLGPAETIQQAYERRFFWRVTLVNFTVAVAFSISLFMLVVFAIRREFVYGWFGAFAGMLATHNLFAITVELPVSNAMWDFLTYVLFGTLLLTGTKFTFRFLNVARPRGERVLVLIYLAGLGVLAPWIWIDPSTLNRLGSDIWLAFVLLAALYPIGALVQRIISNPDTDV